MEDGVIIRMGFYVVTTIGGVKTAIRSPTPNLSVLLISICQWESSSGREKKVVRIRVGVDRLFIVMMTLWWK